MIEGTLIPIDRMAADRPLYSGKHRRHGMNFQVISAPDGEILWVPGPLPGAVHDLAAARICGILRELAASTLIVLASIGYAGRQATTCASPTGAGASPHFAKGRQPRGHAQLKTWRILRKLRCCPWRASGNSPKPSTSFKPARSEDEKVQCVKNCAVVTCDASNVA